LAPLRWWPASLAGLRNGEPNAQRVPPHQVARNADSAITDPY
jgi:hypothetical protein